MKTPEMNRVLDGLTKSFFGRSRSDALAAGKCVTCDGDAMTFKDQLSSREYRISGLRQACQNKVFANGIN